MNIYKRLSSPEIPIKLNGLSSSELIEWYKELNESGVTDKELIIFADRDLFTTLQMSLLKRGIERINNNILKSIVPDYTWWAFKVNDENGEEVFRIYFYESVYLTHNV